MLTYLDANGQTYLSLLPTSSQVAMSRIYVGLCTIVPLNGKSSIHLLFPCPDATFDSRPTLHQSRWLSREKLQVLFLPLAGTAGGTSAFSFCLLPFFGCSGAKLVTLVTVSPELQKKKIGSDEANVYSLLKTRMEKELAMLRSSWRLPVEVFKEGPPHS